MSRIRELKPPPKDRPVQFFFKNGTAGIYAANDRELVGVVAWCLPAQLDGTTSGPVHSLEAQELPEPEEIIEIRQRGRWFPGFLGPLGWYAVHPLDGTWIVGMKPDAWRPLPDDEPGDAELLEAAKEVLQLERFGGHAKRREDTWRRFEKLVEERSGK